MEIVAYLVIGYFVICYLVWTIKLSKSFNIANDIIFDAKPNTAVSIVVAMRNEEANISNLLNAIYAQQNAPTQRELILVDDYSTDNTLQEVKNWKQEHSDFNIRIISMNDFPNAGYGKKAAIAKGISGALFDIIITTDADCIMGINWLNGMCNYFTQTKVSLLAGPVLLQSNTWFGKLQQLEMILLQALTCATFKQRKPVMCNAANMMFYKNDFLVLNSDNLKSNVASGDDLFLMLAIKHKKLPMDYTLSKECIVHTNAINDFSAFVNQRIRWASKIEFVNDKDVFVAGSLVMGINLLLFLFLGMGLMCLIPLYCFVILFVLKFLCDIILLQKYLTKLQLKYFWFPTIIYFEFLFPIYNVFIFVLSIFGKYNWKGRGY